MRTADVKAVANLLHGLAVMQYCPEDGLMARFAALSAPHLNKFSGGRCADVLWALSVFQFDAGKEWYRGAAACLCTRISSASPRQLAQLAAAIRAVPAGPAARCPLWQAYISAGSECLLQLEPSEIAACIGFVADGMAQCAPLAATSAHWADGAAIALQSARSLLSSEEALSSAASLASLVGGLPAAQQAAWRAANGAVVGDLAAAWELLLQQYDAQELVALAEALAGLEAGAVPPTFIEAHAAAFGAVARHSSQHQGDFRDMIDSYNDRMRRWFGRSHE